MTKDGGELGKLILWLRKNGVSWRTLTVGSVTVEGADMRLAENLPQPAIQAATPAATIYTRYGRDLLEEAAKSDGMTSVVEIDD